MSSAVTPPNRLTLRQLTGEISKISTVSSADTMAVLDAFLSIIPGELAKGNIVELGDFGNFWLKSSAEGVEIAKSVRASQISGILPRVSPGKEFKKVLGTIEYEGS